MPIKKNTVNNGVRCSLLSVFRLRGYIEINIFGSQIQQLIHTQVSYVTHINACVVSFDNANLNSLAEIWQCLGETKELLHGQTRLAACQSIVVHTANTIHTNLMKLFNLLSNNCRFAVK